MRDAPRVASCSGSCLSPALKEGARSRECVPWIRHDSTRVCFSQPPVVMSLPTGTKTPRTCHEGTFCLLQCSSVVTVSGKEMAARRQLFGGTFRSARALGTTPPSLRPASGSTSARCAATLAQRRPFPALPLQQEGLFLRRNARSLFTVELPIPACGHPFVRSIASLRQLACVSAWAARALKRLG